MSPEHIEEQYDAIIVGAGAAGLSAALGFYSSEAYERMREQGREPRVLVVSKLQPLRSHTGSAEGGIAATLGNMEPDDWHWHYYDTVKGGDWLVDQDAAQILTQEAVETVVRLEHGGVAFSRTEDGHIAQRRFGGHTSDFGGASVKRAAYCADRVGHQILYTLWQQCVHAGVQFAEEWYVTDLVLNDDHTRCVGVIAFDTQKGVTHALRSSTVLLATGGAGRLFHTTSNSYDLTGDGMTLALNAGLQLEDMEFIQFHPTGLAHTGILLSEASRAEGGILRNAQGEAFMTSYAPEHGDLAARDVVSRSIRMETNAGRGVADPKDPDGARDCVWLDMTGIDADHMHAVLPQVVETIEQYADLDPTVDYVPVKPTAHYTMGGIPVTTDAAVYTYDHDERHLIQGLYAAGECSCVSVHGANRLGGNSLLDACVFGTRAGRSIADYIEHTDEFEDTADEYSNNLAQAQSLRNTDIDALLNAAHVDEQADDEHDNHDNAYQVMTSIGMIMEEGFAVSCNQQSLEQALAHLDDEIAPRIDALHAHSDTRVCNQELTAIWEARHLVQLARMVIVSALHREESRGSLSRTDFPQRNDEEYLNHTMIATDDHIERQPVHIIDIEPGTRAY